MQEASIIPKQVGTDELQTLLDIGILNVDGKLAVLELMNSLLKKDRGQKSGNQPEP